MPDRQGNRVFVATLVASVGGAALLIVWADASAALVAGYVAAVQIVVHVLAPAGGGLSKIVLGVRVRRAMARGEIVLHYQPRISLATGELLGVEALARWRHRRRGLLAPAEWIAGTELWWNERRFMEYTLDLALRQGVEWCQRHDLDVLISVNVTPRCYADAAFPRTVEQALERAGLGATQLQLELTEAALDLSPTAVDVATRLTAMGIGLSLDDFGIGHSSMERLARLPINELKIDRRFVSRHTSSPRDAAIVRGAIDLGHALGVAVTAEGVEESHDAEALRRDGCDTAQGFLYAPALPAEELLRWERERIRQAAAAPERRRLPDRRLWQRRTHGERALAT